MFLKSKILTLSIVAALSVFASRAGGAHDGEENQSGESRQSGKYSYASRGVVHVPAQKMKLLLDETNLGGKELEIAEMTFAAGYDGEKHPHGSVEIFYVLSGTFGHEVNGERHLLTPSMVGVVRPGDIVRHFVPKEADARVLVIWTPSGEAKRIGISAPLRCSDPKQIATYKGSGELTDAKSFECKGS